MLAVLLVVEFQKGFLALIFETGANLFICYQVDRDEAQWQRNAAGLWHSHKHGFGLMNAWRLTNAAAVGVK